MLAGLCSISVCVCVFVLAISCEGKKTRILTMHAKQSSSQVALKFSGCMWGCGAKGGGEGACFAVQEPADFGIDDDPPPNDHVRKRRVWFIEFRSIRNWF